MSGRVLAASWLLVMAGVPAARGGGNPDAVFSVELKGEKLASGGAGPALTGKPAAALAGFSPGDTLEMAVVVEGARSLRVVEFFLAYDPAGLTFLDWKRDPRFSQGLEIGPLDKPEVGQVQVAASLYQPLVPPAGQKLEVGRLRFRLRVAARAEIGVKYVMLVDGDFGSDVRGTRPVPEKPAPGPEVKRPEVRALRIAGDLWWSEAYPNPFQSFTRISFYAPDSLWITINVMDKKGKLVCPLVNDRYKGRFHTTWNGVAFSGDKVGYGDYEVVIKAGDHPEQRQTVHYVAKPDSAAEPQGREPK